jgi:hypothetical protein
VIDGNDRSLAIRAAIDGAMVDVVQFVQEAKFCQALNEMWQLPERLRHEFVSLVFLDRVELDRRGVEVPREIMIQRSEFEDKRATLFCVSRSLPPGHVWKKVTITFDNRDPDTFLPIDHEALEA